MAAAFILPGLQSLTNWVPIPALDEHRAPAAAPDFALLLQSDSSKFAKEANAWFDDRAGFRDLYIRAKNQIDFSVFHTHRKVYIGKDGWLFERQLTDDRFAIERLPPQQYSELEEGFFNLKKSLAQRGIRLVIVDYPDKSEFYPEFLPDDVPNLPIGGRRDRLRNILKSDPDIIYIDVASILRPYKAEGQPLFYKTDIHVNTEGSIPVLREIIRRIAEAEGRDIAWHEKLKFEFAQSSGSEARFLSVLTPVTESLMWSPGFYEIGKPVEGGTWSAPDARRIAYPGWSDFPVYDWEFVSSPDKCGDRLPAAALFGDSFSDPYWSLGVQQYFCRIRRARTPVERLGPYLQDLPPETKYFIFEFTSPFVVSEAPRLKFDAPSRRLGVNLQ